MNVTIQSFSCKLRLPEDKTGNGWNFVFDCQAMPNLNGEQKLHVAKGDTARKSGSGRVGMGSVWLAEDRQQRIKKVI